MDLFSPVWFKDFSTEKKTKEKENEIFWKAKIYSLFGSLQNLLKETEEICFKKVIFLVWFIKL